ncbi:helix-turn-helix domain-containing protein [Candidatus Poribacteria bacterium]|nr:helix-turn-helix domain-containing protein [Candidatus Poribacteria bacterium]
MKKIFTPQEIAEFLHVAPTTIYAELERGKLPHGRVGRKYIITRRHLEDYLTKEVVEELLVEEEQQDTSADLTAESEINGASPWLDVIAQDMTEAIAAVEKDVPEAEHQTWLKAMAAAVKPLEVEDA